MKLIIGLGNPGEIHEKTRHNLGFMAVERFLKDFKPVNATTWENSEKFKSDIAQIEWEPKHGSMEKVILAKPRTYMNNSGLAVSLLTTYYKIQATDVWVLHDEIDLPVGSIRIRMGGSSAGHKGVESIIEKVGTEKFWRFRLGIGHPKNSSKLKVQSSKFTPKHVDEFVLEPFASDEHGSIKHLIKHTSQAISEALEHGIESSANKFNTK